VPRAYIRPPQERGVTEVILLLAAEIQAQAIYAWLEEMRPASAGDFEVQFRSAIEQLRRYPESGSMSPFGYRRVMISGFPYGMYYKRNGRRVTISAVADVRQDPAAIRRLLQ
jgi:plasmid stabilization system protein ParE